MSKAPVKDDAKDSGRIRKRSVIVAGHATSVSLEEAFWRALSDLAAAEGISVNALVSRIDGERGEGGNLSSAIRVYLLENAGRR